LCAAWRHTLRYGWSSQKCDAWPYVSPGGCRCLSMTCVQHTCDPFIAGPRLALSERE
jgi:hypothetical protein